MNVYEDLKLIEQDAQTIKPGSSWPEFAGAVNYLSSAELRGLGALTARMILSIQPNMATSDNHADFCKLLEPFMDNAQPPIITSRQRQFFADGASDVRYANRLSREVVAV